MNCVLMVSVLVMFIAAVLLVVATGVVVGVVVGVAGVREQEHRAVDSRAEIKFILGPRFFKKRIDSGMT